MVSPVDNDGIQLTPASSAFCSSSLNTEKSVWTAYISKSVLVFSPEYLANISEHVS
jgi:hypothetical protein